MIRWPEGAQNTITVPPHIGCRCDGDEIVASFHTHPNTGDDFLQEPGETDIRAVREDIDLKGMAYIGEFVVSQERIYLIEPSGQVKDLGETRRWL